MCPVGAGMVLHKSINVTNYIGVLADKNHIIISIYAEKKLQQNPTYFLDKSPKNKRP